LDLKKIESLTNFSVWPQDLLVGDRAYCNKKGILHVVNQGADVLVRWHSTALPLFTYRGQRIKVLNKLIRTLKGCRNLSSRTIISYVIFHFTRSILKTLCWNNCSRAFVSIAGEMVNR